VAIAREVDGEEAVLGLRVRSPEDLSLAELDRRIRNARVEPVDQVRHFRRQLLISRLPGPVRRFVWWLGQSVTGSLRERYFGTYGLTGVAGLGSEEVWLLSPLTITLTFGIVRPDGTVRVRLYFDHRVLDGSGPSRALAELEAVLYGPIRAELTSAPACRAA
jgi:hypothetical protein